MNNVFNFTAFIKQYTHDNMQSRKSGCCTGSGLLRHGLIKSTQAILRAGSVGMRVSING